MKRLYTLTLCLIFLVSGFSQVRFTEVNTTSNDITLTNMGTNMEDISSWFFCSSFGYDLLITPTLVSGSLDMMPGASVTLNWSGGGMNNTMSDLCLYNTNSFTDTIAMQDFTQWGSGGNGRESVAVEKGIWNAGDFISDPTPYIFYGSANDYGLSFWSPPVIVSGPCQDLFFSEYIEGSSSNKAFEIFNPTSSDIDLTDYVVYRANNGSLTATDSIFPQGMIAAGDVYVIANPSANADIMTEMDTLHTLTFYNGDDAVWIQKISSGEMLDLIGEIGVDPGSGWTVGTGATNNFTLVRNIAIQQGSTDWATGATEWDVYPIDDISFLGAHEMQPCGVIAPCTELFFSEIIEGSSSNKAIEVYNPTGATVDLTNYQILRFNNGSVTPSGTFNFPAGAMLADGDVWVSANGSADPVLLAVADEDTSSVTFYNGDDAMVLMNTLLGDTLDIIGVVGVDPGSGWPVGTGATNNNTLVRMSSVQSGTTDWSVGATQWDVFPIDDFTHAGSHTMNPCGASDVFVGFASSALAVDEDAGTLSLGVGLTNNNGDPVDVTVSLGTGGTATDAIDFTNTLPQDIGFSGTTDEVLTFDIGIVDDADIEGEETIELVLTTATSGTVLTIDTLTITINASDMVIPTYPIGDVNNVDVDGVSDSLGVECKIIGTVYGVNMQGGPEIQFTMHDGTGGMGVFSSDNLGYTVTEGDEIRLIGLVAQFNGLTQMNPDSIVLLSTGNPLNDPTVITVQDESTESELITIECVTLDDPSQWTTGSSFNADVSNTNGSYVIRIDSDTDVAGLAAPTGVFTVTGIGGQFDSSVPHDEGYQLLPRYIADINENDATCIIGVDEIQSFQTKVYPNPGMGELTIEIEIAVNDILIFNSLGQEVSFTMEQVQGQVNIDLTGNEAGMYQIMVLTEKGNTALQYVLTK